MTRSDGPSDLTPEQAEILDAMSKLSPDEMRALFDRLLTSDLYGSAFEPPEPASQRRPPRDDVVTLRVRVDLVGAKPPLWRRLELASDLTLDEVHEVLQIAFGWTDSHLHRFAAGPQEWGPETEHYLCPFDVAEGSRGVPEEHVRLDELLAEPGDRIFYTYDYGDDWTHTIRLEAVEEHAASDPAAVCTGGRRSGPPEDCGGIYGYELVVAATDPSHPDHDEATAEFRRMYGDDIDPGWYRPTSFDLDDINAILDANGFGA